MDEKLSELVSAWMDGELRRGERRRGARELARRPEARERLGRYRLIGEALRGARRTPADLWYTVSQSSLHSSQEHLEVPVSMKICILMAPFTLPPQPCQRVIKCH